MKREEDVYAAFCAAWLLAAFAFPDWKLSLGILGASAGSSSQGANPFIAEAAGILLGLWALSRLKVPPWAKLAAGLWGGLIAFEALQGHRHGHALKDVLAEGRAGLFAAFLPALAALPQRHHRLALKAAGSGLALWALMSFEVLLIEPTGMANPNIVPVPVPAIEHALYRLFPYAALGLLAGGLASLLIWVMAWLSYVRALWIAWPLASLLAALYLALRGEGRAALRQLAFQAGAGLLALGVLLLALRIASPDGEFLLRFRLQRTLQAAHLVPALPEAFDPGSPRSLLLRGMALRGGLFRNLAADAGAPSAREANQADPSLSDRALMRREAWKAFRAAPLCGQGLGALFRYDIYPGNGRVLRDPHNGYAWLLAKCGLLGGVVFLGLLAFAGATLWRSGRPQACAVLGLFLILEFFQAGLLNYEVSLALALLAALPWEGSHA